MAQIPVGEVDSVHKLVQSVLQRAEEGDLDIHETESVGGVLQQHVVPQLLSPLQCSVFQHFCKLQHSIDGCDNLYSVPCATMDCYEELGHDHMVARSFEELPRFLWQSVRMYLRQNSTLLGPLCQ